MRRVGPRGTTASCLLALVVALGCGAADSGRRVLLVGIDGASLRVARPMLRRGELPNLAQIASRGVYGPLRAPLPLSSPRIWASIATGKSPEHHGILTFARTLEDGSRRLYQSTDRTAHALWNIASDAGLTVAVVNWWTTYPVEKIHGVLISDHLLAGEIEGRRALTGAAPAAGGPIVYPEEWQDRLAGEAPDAPPLTDVPNPFGDADAFPAWANAAEMAQRYRSDERVARIALAVEAEIRPDLMLVFLPGIDRISHRLWGALEPDAPGSPFTPEQREASAAALRAYYRFTDALIGRLVARYDADDLVLVVSDHGFEAGSPTIFLTGRHKTPKAADGVLFARGAHVAAPETPRPVTVNDITPTILAWLGLPVGDDMDGRPAPFLALDPAAIARVATHDTGPIERLGRGPSGQEKAMLEELEALGYFQDGGGK
jgi:predicted AlkP superfamily pyrophosphatase or phosphodiesterase